MFLCKFNFSINFINIGRNVVEKTKYVCMKVYGMMVS